jgi:hypothetical protein
VPTLSGDVHVKSSKNPAAISHARRGNEKSRQKTLRIMMRKITVLIFRNTVHRQTSNQLNSRKKNFIGAGRSHR